jgi:hypothetical protein
MAENNEILLLNGHENGELNLWRLQVESGVDGGSGGGREAQQQTASQRQNAMSVVNVIHGYRLCEPSKVGSGVAGKLWNFAFMSFLLSLQSLFSKLIFHVSPKSV